MAYAVRVTESTTRAGAILSSGNAGTYLTDAIPLATNRRFVFDILVPTLTGGSTITFSITWSAVSGSGYAAVSGTTMTVDSTGGHWNYLETTTEYIQSLNPTAQYIKGSLVVGTAASNTYVACRAYDIRWAGGTDTAAAASGSVTLQTSP